MIIMYKGLPGSGKTRAAKKLLAQNPGKFKRINKDDLRDMLDGGYWSNKNEQYILKVRDQLIAQALLANKTVLIDDTNLHPKHERRLREFADKYNCEFTIKDFTSVSVDECIMRDLQRDISVGEKVIKKMWRQFIDDKKPKKMKQNKNLTYAIICDLDGTLSLLNGRNPYDASTCDQDLINYSIVNILRKFKCDGYEILFVSGREDKFRSQTETFLLDTRFDIHYLFMRKTGDTREDSIVKKELFEEHIKDKFYIEFVLDDRDRVVKMWRELGLTCLQVAEGDF